MLDNEITPFEPFQIRAASIAAKDVKRSGLYQAQTAAAAAEPSKSRKFISDMASFNGLHYAQCSFIKQHSLGVLIQFSPEIKLNHTQLTLVGK